MYIVLANIAKDDFECFHVEIKNTYTELDLEKRHVCYTTLTYLRLIGQ
jgi:hypothetical protein